MVIIQDNLMNDIIRDYNNGFDLNKLSEKYTEFSVDLIQENLKRMNIYQTSYITNEELELIKIDYQNGSTLDQLARKYNRHKKTIRKKLQESELYNTRIQLPYSDEEISILKRYYPTGDWDNLLKYLPNRNKNSITSKASKLGIGQENWNWSKEEVINILSGKGYYLLSEFSNIKNKHNIIDNEGYKYYTNLTGLVYSISNPIRFSHYNTYTIDNIKHFIVINNIDCELLSDEYINNSTDLKWKCHCGNIFLCPWATFRDGKHQCNECSNIALNEKKSLTIDEVKNLISNKPYTMIDETFTTLTDGFTAITDDGYYVKIDRNNIYKNAKPEIFHKNNPYTINNIKNYIRINNISTHLVSTQYNNNQECLEWKCECGNHFKRSWSGFLSGATYCLECLSKQKGLSRRITIDEINKIIESRGYYLAEPIEDNAITDQIIIIFDKDGYYYNTRWSQFKSGKTPERFHLSNKFTLQNINNYLKLNRNGEYTCIENKYLGNDKEMKYKHNLCGCKFDATWPEMQGKLMPNKKDRYYKQCPKCNKRKTESIHASIVKQVFLHEYPDTTLEDKTCINPNTNYPLPTDIVNHRLKIAIEIQSKYHDAEARKSIDIFKKKFWTDKGYKFYDPDIRHYSILEMIQIFFPSINQIPSYIKYNFSNCIDFTKIQILLNKGYTISEISNILNIKKGTIQGFITSKKVFLPNGYKNKVFNIKPIIRLSKEGNFIEKFESLCDVDCKGYASGTVRRVLDGKQKFSYDSFWVYEEDYINNNYEIPEIDFDKFALPVMKYSMDDKFICEYNSIYEAESDSISNRNEIYRVASGDRKSSRNEKWKFKNVA